MMNRKDIRLTKPNTVCKYCVLHHFVNFNGKQLEEQYAECTNKIKSWGMWSIDITEEGNPLQWETTCRNCKQYESKRQLSIFDSENL